MKREKWDDDCDAHRDYLAVENAFKGDLVRAAMEDILRGHFDSFAVKLAESEGLMRMAKIT